MLQISLSSDIERRIVSEVRSGSVKDVETLITDALAVYFHVKNAGFSANGPKALPGATSQAKLRKHYPQVELTSEDVERERWKQIPGSAKFMISDMGRVKSFTGRILKNQRNTGGYVQVFIKKIDGRGRNITVHRVVAELFLPNPRRKPEVNHMNGKKADCRLSNLEWVTREENTRHAVQIGLRPGRTPIVVDK